MLVSVNSAEYHAISSKMTTVSEPKETNAQKKHTSAHQTLFRSSLIRVLNLAESIQETRHMKKSKEMTEMKVRLEPVQHDAKAIENFERKPPLKLPPPHSTKWPEIEEDLCATLDGVLLCSGKDKIKSLSINDLVDLCEERVYGVLARHCKDTGTTIQNRKQKSRQDRPRRTEKRLKAEKTRFTQQFKAAKHGELNLSERKFHVTLRRFNTVRHTRLLKVKQRTEAKQQAKFRRDPWKYGTEVFKPRNAGKPSFDAKAAEDHFTNLYVDSARQTQYKAPLGCKQPPLPTVLFDVSTPKIKQLRKPSQRNVIVMPQA